MKRSAVGAIAAQGAQALASFVLQIVVARTLGISGLGAFSILYGVVVLASGTVTGFVGDSLVILDRRLRPVRSALEQFALLLAFGTGLLAAVTTTALRFTTPVEGLLLALAIAAFCLEEVVRRTLMAELHFWRVATIDTLGLLVTMGIVGSTALTGALTLGVFLGALAVGQTAAMVVGGFLVQRPDRFLVGFTGGGRREVAAYGIWRSLQQFLRPALLTAVRTGVGVVAGLAATGLLEAARVYVAPALLLVSGLSSYLFASFARQRDLEVRVRLRRADRAVAALLALTVGIGVVAIVLLPLAGPALFASTPDLRAVAGWLAYTASVAAVTPYGALAAVNGGQATVFAIRAADTVLSLAAVIAGLALGMDPAWAAALLAIGSIAGGLALRHRTARLLGRARSGRRIRRVVAGSTAIGAVLVVGGVGAALATQHHPVPAPSPTREARRVITVLGDEIGAAPGSDGDHWVTRLPDASRIDAQVLGGPGSGYTDTGGGTTFRSLATRIDPRARTVVLVGGRNDRGVPSLTLIRAVTSTVSAVHRTAPRASVVLVAPIWPGADPPAVAAVRLVLRNVARATDATFIDPGRAASFAEGDGTDATGSSLDASGEQRLAAAVAPALNP